MYHYYEKEIVLPSNTIPDHDNDARLFPLEKKQMRLLSEVEPCAGQENPALLSPVTLK